MRTIALASIEEHDQMLFDIIQNNTKLYFNAYCLRMRFPQLLAIVAMHPQLERKWDRRSFLSPSPSLSLYSYFSFFLKGAWTDAKEKLKGREQKCEVRNRKWKTNETFTISVLFIDCVENMHPNSFTSAELLLCAASFKRHFVPWFTHIHIHHEAMIVCTFCPRFISASFIDRWFTNCIHAVRIEILVAFVCDWWEEMR